MISFYEIPIGCYAEDEKGFAEGTLCLECSNQEGRTDILSDIFITYAGYPDGFTCVECGHVVPCDPDTCTCEKENQ